MPHALPIAAVLVFALVLAGCSSGPRIVEEHAVERCPVPMARVRVLGIAQDGGVPHAGCTCPNCTAALADPARRAHVASLAIIVPSTERPRAPDKVYLIDATPDVADQIRMLADVRDAPAARTDRTPVDGLFLTHAHIGHYLGLAQFGFEVMHTNRLPVWCTDRMAAFLRTNAPWSQLVDKQEIDLRPLTAGDPVDLGSGITVTPILVPHRSEFTDTCAFVIRGPRRTIFYMPDCDPWHRWIAPIDEILAGEHVDVAILDATFYSMDELPGRDLSAIGHPPIVTTMDTLQPNVDAGLDVRFIHLNHSNPALDPASPERAEINRRGFAVAHEGEEIEL
ncbi:MAG: MBL fold metallo-hydrolase [Phycisphaerales bacterium]